MPKSERRYSGMLHAQKCYVGEKSVDIQIESNYALDLAGYLIEAVKSKAKVDLTVHMANRFKDGCCKATVTWRR